MIALGADQYAGTYADMESPLTVYITSETYAHALRMHYAAHTCIRKHNLRLCFHLSAVRSAMRSTFC